MLVGAALAIKAEAIDRLGDPAGAAAVLSKAVEVDVAASKQFAELVLRESLSLYCARAEEFLVVLIGNGGKDDLSAAFARALLPLRLELRNRRERNAHL
jgi:hypothetical protein